MKPVLSRGIKSAQLKMRLIAVAVSGTAGTPAASGFDESQIESVVDNGTGDYTIILKKPFESDLADNCQAMVQSLTAGIMTQVSAVDYDRVTVKCFDDAGAAADADLFVWILGCDHRFTH